MGGIVTKLYSGCFGPKAEDTKDMRILMVGLDGAGKTTILYTLKLGEVITTIPSIGFNVESVEYKNTCFTVWDMGGRDTLRQVRKHYYQNTRGIIFVVDSSDRERLDSSNGCGRSARDELHELLEADELQDAALLVLANKQDLPNAMREQEVSDRLGLDMLQNRQWFVQPASVRAGEGLFEGLDWLAHAVGRA